MEKYLLKGSRRGGKKKPYCSTKYLIQTFMLSVVKNCFAELVYTLLKIIFVFLRFKLHWQLSINFYDSEVHFGVSASVIEI